MDELVKYPRELEIGYVSEQYTRTPTIDVSELLPLLPGADVLLMVRRPREDRAYVADTELSGTTLTWTVVASDVKYPGVGCAQVLLVKTENGVERRLLGPLITVRIRSAVTDVTDETPAQYDSYMQRMDAAIALIDDMTATATALPSGSQPTVELLVNSGAYELAFGLPAGAKGDTGATGPQGPKGDTGAAGQDGADGADGVDGITPNIQVGTVTTVAPDVSASVTRRSGSPDAAPIFDFSIPRGQTGSIGTVTAGDIPMSSSDQTSVASAIGAIPKTADTLPVSAYNQNPVTQLIAQKTTLEQVYPVGSIYLSTSMLNPVTIFGFGVWTRIENRFLIGAGDLYDGGDEGGEATHTLTVQEMPSHTHSPSSGADFLVYHGTSQGTSGAASGSIIKRTDIGATGGGQAHNNMPPYLAVYMWERTA